MRLTAEEIQKKVKNGEYNFNKNSSDKSSNNRISAEDIQRQVKNRTFKDLDYDYIDEQKRQIISHIPKQSESKSSGNHITIAATQLAENESKSIGSNNLSYEDKKAQAKEQKKEAGKNLLKAALAQLGNQQQNQDTTSSYLSAKKEYDTAKNNLKTIKENRDIELQSESKKLLDDAQIAELVKNAYSARESAGEKTQAATNTNDFSTAIMGLIANNSNDYDTSEQENEFDGYKKQLNEILEQKNSSLSADDLISYYTYQQNVHKSQEMAEGYNQASQEHPVIMGAGRVLSSPYAALSNVATTTGDLLTDGNYTYSSANHIQDSRRGIKSGIEDKLANSEMPDLSALPGVDKNNDINILGKNYGNIYSSIYDAIDMSAENVYTSLIMGGGITGGIKAIGAAEKIIQAPIVGAFTSSTMGEQVAEAKANGENIKDIYAKAGKDAIINFATEMLGTPLEKYDGVLSTVTSEALEEIIGNAVSNLDDIIRLQDEGEIRQTYNEYISQGNSESEALALTVKDLLADDIYAAGIAAFSSLGMAGSQSITNNIQKNNVYRNVGSQLKSSGNVQSEINTGLASDTQSKAYKAAQALQSSLEQTSYDNNIETVDYSSLSNKKLGKLQHYNTQAISQSAFAKAVENESNSEELNKVFTKITEGKAISNSNAKVIASSEAAVQAINSEFGTDYTSEDITANELSNLSKFYDNDAKYNSGSVISELTNNDYTDKKIKTDTSYLKNDVEFLRENAPVLAKNAPEKAITLSNGSSDFISGVNSVKDGKVYLDTESGSVVDANQVTYNSNDAQQLYSSASVYNTNEAKAYVMGYYDNGYNGTVADYSNGFGTVYMAAMKGRSFQQAFSLAAENGSSITEAQAMVAFDAAKKSSLIAKKAVSQQSNKENKKKAKKAKMLSEPTAVLYNSTKAKFDKALKAESKPGVTVFSDKKIISSQQKAEIELIGAYAKSIGREVIIVDDTEELGYGRANGFYNNGKIVLALNADGGILSPYLGHELFHDLKVNSKEQAQKLENFVIDYLKGRADYDYNARVDKIIELNEFTGTREQQVAQANEEIAANACFTVFSKQENFEKLVRQDKPLAQKVRDFFADFIEKIKNALDSISIRNAEYRALQNEQKTQEKILDMFDECLKVKQENNTNSSNIVKYSYAGENAKGSNKVSLSYAKTLENQGVDSEKIRQQTGWFKGYDGKWKFEINDKDMKINKQGLYSRNPDIRRFVELEQKAYFDGTATTSEVDELQQLSKNLKGVKITPNRLGDIMVHPELFKAYPQLADYKITFTGKFYDDSRLGSYANNEIQLNRFLSGDKLKSSFIHEIQHAIQHIEDFETGTNPIIAGSYDNYKNNAGEIEARDVSNRVNYSDEQRKNIRPDIDRENVRFYTDDILPYKNTMNYDIKKTTDNRSVVIIKEDILKGVNKKNWVNVVKKNIKNKFNSAIPISGKFVKVNVVSRNELTNSKYTKYLRSSDGTIYADKLKSTNNLDEIIIASTNYINEDLNHKRKDNIVQFARGCVLLEIGSNQYSASIIIGYTSSNEMLLYDIVDFVPTKFKMKKEDTSIAMQQNAGSYRNEVSSNNNVPQNDTVVNNSNMQDEPKFSLKEPIEETKDLIAVHNISEEKLMKTLQLGGLPMPSIAIMKAKEAKGNSFYGNISLVFPKSTIDPSLNTDNKIYGGDAWTPVYPTVEYKINEDKANEIYSRARKATKNAYAYKLNSVSFHPSNIEDTLNRLKGESGLIDSFKNDYGMKQLYLAETGEPVKAVMVKETRTELSDGQVEMYDYLIENFGDTLSILDNGTYPARKWVQEHGDEFDNVRREYYRYKTPDITEEQLDNIFNNLNEKPIDKVRLARQINRYRRNGRATVETENDNEATEKEIDGRINQKEYEKWLNDLFFGIAEKKGIRNNIDPYTSSGNMRSFEQLHYEETLENVVKQMRTQNNGDVALFSGLGIWGVAAKNYGTLEQVKSDSFRLQNLSEDEFKKIKGGFGERLYEIAESLENKYKADNPFIDNENKFTNIIDALRESKTKSGVLKYLKQYFKNASESTVDDLLDLVADIGNMPVDYFEAKPQRAVKFNEIAKVILPDNASTELKSILEDNKIEYLEYPAGDDNARVEAINSLDSAKFSKKEQPIDYNAVLRENEELAQMNEDLKRMLELSASQNEKLRNEFKLTDRHNLSNSAVDRVAANLRKQYASTYDKTSLVYNLSALYDYIANAGTDIDSGYIWTAAHDIAMNIVDNTQQKDTAIYDEYKDLRKRIRNTVIRVPETVRNSFTDYEQFRKSNFGRLRLSNNSGIELDSFYNELSAEYPEFFDRQVFEEQQLEALANFFESTAPVYYNASEYTADSMGLNMQQYSNLVAGDILEKYFDVPEVQTVAEKHKKEIDTLKLHYRNKISELRQSYKERYDERLNEVREENRKKVNKLRQDKAEALAKQKAHFEDVSKRGRERRNKSKLRVSIRKSLNKIASLGANPDKKKHIPNAIIDSVKAFADAVALDDTKQDQKIRDRLNQFRNGFESIKKENSQYAVISELYNDFIREQIIELQNTVGSKTIKELSVSELEQIDKLVKMTAQSISNINRLFNKDRNATIEQYADNIASELEPFRKGKIRNTPLNSLAFNSLKPEYFFQYIGSDTLSDLYHDLRKGEDTWAVDVSQARKFALEIRKKYGWKKWDTKAKQKFSTAYGEIELSLQERLGIYANSLGEHTKNHLLGGGFKYQQSKATGIAKLKKQTNDNSSHRLSEDDVSNIVASLSEEQTAYVRDMITYLSTVMGEKGNEISRQLYDIELFKEKMYYPAKVDRESTHQITKEVRAEKQIKNAGFTNAAIENAKQPLILMDFDEVWASHVDEMSKYHAFVLPLENLDRVYNLYEVDSDNKYSSVKEIIKNAYGTKALAYIDDLIRDINGGVVQEAGTDILSSLTSKFKKNAVFASASVTIQQPSAIARALSEIDAKYFAQTTGSGFNRKAYEEMKKYAPVAIIKEMGYFDTNMAQSTVDYLNKNDYNGLKEKAKAFVVDGSYRDDAMSFFASKADEITWTHIWNAVKAETQAKNPELSGNSEQLLSKAGERFTEVITKTQVYDSVFSRSGLMRSRDNAVKNAMAFMAEPTTSLNMLTNAVMQAKHGKISKAKAGRVFASLISASMLNSILQSIVTAARADDDEKDWKEVYLSQLLPNFIDNLNPVNQIAFLKDIYNIFQGYDVTRADMNLFSDLYNAIQRLDSDKVTISDKVTGLAGAISAFFGFPLKNINRDVKAAYNVAKDAFDDVHFDKENALDTFKEEMNSYLGFELFNSKYENAVKSIENGKMTDYVQYADELYAGSEAYDLLYAILKKYGYNSSQYKKEADRCIEVKKENGSSNPNPDTAMKNRAIKEYAYLKESGTYAEAEAARQRCIQIYGDMTKVNEALKKLNN